MKKTIKIFLIVLAAIVFSFFVYKTIFYFSIKNRYSDSDYFDSFISKVYDNFSNHKTITIKNVKKDSNKVYYEYENLKMEKSLFDNFVCSSKKDSGDLCGVYAIRDDDSKNRASIMIQKTKKYSYDIEQSGNNYREFVRYNEFDHDYIYNLSKDLQKNNIKYDYFLYKYEVDVIKKGINCFSSYYAMERYNMLQSLLIISMPSYFEQYEDLSLIYDEFGNYKGYIVGKNYEEGKIRIICLDAEKENYDIILFSKDDNIPICDNTFINNLLNNTFIESNS